VAPVKYELGIYIPEDEILHCHSRENLRSYICEKQSPDTGFMLHCRIMSAILTYVYIYILLSALEPRSK
jgi:hypothetical protein